MVDKQGNRIFSTDADGNKHYKSIAFTYGTITASKKAGRSSKITRFDLNSESAGAELFKFFADNTKIEYGLICTQKNGSVVMTNHNESSVMATATAKKISKEGYTVTTVVHNHPMNSNPSGFRKNDKRGDKLSANTFITSHGYLVEYFVYQPRTGNIVSYDKNNIIGTMSWGMIFTPSSSRRQNVYPIKRYPGVGLPPH
nr:JAB-like toxin 1 domain-containing protein [Porphyromonas levii]